MNNTQNHKQIGSLREKNPVSNLNFLRSSAKFELGRAFKGTENDAQEWLQFPPCLASLLDCVID